MLLGVQSVCGQGDANVQDAVTNLVRMHNAWGPSASSPNASLTIQESSRSGRTIKFRLSADGVPKDGIYSIVAWPVTKKTPIDPVVPFAGC
jgi:hypothetical protein